MLIKSLSTSFIIAWNVAGEFVNLKNITVSSKNPSSIVKAAFHSSPFLILTLLYPHHRSIFVNTFLYLCFLVCLISKGGGRCFLLSTHSSTYNLAPFASFHPSFQQRILAPSEMTLTVMCTSFLTVPR